MTTQVQFRRGTTAEHDAFTGAVGEVTVDTTKGVPVVHDGVTPGGHPMLIEGLPTISDLRVLNTRPAMMIVNGDTAAGDGGGGLYMWDPLSTDPDDGAGVIEPLSGGIGRWVRYSAWLQAPAVLESEKGQPDGVATLNAQGKLASGQIPEALLGAIDYQGVWNADTNTPAIPAADADNKGWYYKVSVAGTTDIDGTTDWEIGDWIVSNGTTWDKIDNTEPPASGIVNDSGVAGGNVAEALDALSGDISTLASDVADREVVGMLAGLEEYTTSENLPFADRGKLIEVNSATPVTITIQTDAAGGYSGMCWFTFQQIGDGALTIAADTGVTLAGVPEGSVQGPGKGPMITLVRKPSAPNTWAISLDGVA